MTASFKDERLPARFWAKVEVQPSGCWLWTASVSHEGYSHYFHEGRKISGHRASYLVLRGSIPEGMHVDHLCSNRGCVNPDHLELVTPAENVRRCAPAQKEFCAHGHQYTPENTYLRPDQPRQGRRDCRTCIRERARRYSAKKRRAA